MSQNVGAHCAVCPLVSEILEEISRIIVWMWNSSATHLTKADGQHFSAKLTMFYLQLEVLKHYISLQLLSTI